MFIKVQKDSSYFRRYQTKFRRRREGKTDYQARRRMILQDRNKYNSPKYRLIVRISLKDVCVQVAYAKVCGDEIVASAYAHELARFGANVGINNYAGCYATGLLAARRCLAKYKLADKYKGYTGKADKIGAPFNVEPMDEGPRPFKATLDVGLARTTTGARCFGALKGAVDGGLHVPHGNNRFPGFKNGKLDTKAHRARIFGQHVAEYQKKLLAEEPEKYKDTFSSYVRAGVFPDNIQPMWETTHAAIRAAY
eukprot:NODE_3368_length_905_cov_127.124679_g3346_i0.p2 GENE.NODE_3368_length_905_cov_127.124679_g3346_i0~~NODE_3368_length_905_cov_127.124679_g3346_i0.p2  ORF type:complete len:252 (+),score=66.69 NODE_3368_length_905_cov_127.124679_g3346_i0:68-823(+)